MMMMIMIITIERIINMLFAGWEVHMMKNCDRGLENAARVKVPSISSTVAKYRFNSLGTFCERLKLIANGF